MVGLCTVVEAARLLAVDTFGEVAMQKCILHVELVHRPTPAGGEMKHRANRARLDDGRESVGEDDAGTLMTAADDPTSLVPVQSAVPSGFSLWRKTHLPLMTLAPEGRGTSVQVRLRYKASNSSCIAANQCGPRMATRTDDGNGDGAVVDAVQTYLSEL